MTEERRNPIGEGGSRSDPDFTRRYSLPKEKSSATAGRKGEPKPIPRASMPKKEASPSKLGSIVPPHPAAQEFEDSKKGTQKSASDLHIQRGAQHPVQRAILEKDAAKKEPLEVAALIRGAEAEEKRRKREEARRRMASQSPSSTSAKSGSHLGQSASRTGASPNASSESSREVTTMIVAAVSVIAILLILWFMASGFLRSMGDESGGVPVAESTEESEESSESSSESSEAAGKESEENASESGVQPLTEGDGDYGVAETWVGKTFVVEDDANVRSGPGTQNSIVGTVNPGDTITVEEATMVDDSAWVHGTLQTNGKTIEGWLYSWTLSNQKQ